ncbi:SUMO-specific isopeptidase USPL1 [Erpetoichthys calabaricus]|uniref:Ubiquitin specific peptidase like 1 n=1 Tax=Erpetoichthys calabaricus TaxID=27687 RepID=A0A8C4RSP5_ERPCA|nr:SUMO-specific isopeptidase USPL1 [Erpetoichthys calabaricus]
MVMFSKWPVVAADRKTYSDLPMSGEGIDIRVPPYPQMAGYLGKDKCGKSLQDVPCPVCTTRGQKWLLRVYSVNFQESVVLCENPQCIYPLGCHPLKYFLLPNNTPTNLSSAFNLVKRKHISSPECQDFISPLKRRKKTADVIVEESQLVSENSCNNLGNFPKNISSDGKEFLSGSNSQSDSASNVSDNSQQPENSFKANPDTSQHPCSVEKPIDTVANSQRLECVPKDAEMEEIPQYFRIHWRNKSMLCWLDCLLVALVSSRGLKQHLQKQSEEQSPVQKLCCVYEKASNLVSEGLQNNQDHCYVSSEAFAEAQLDEIRMEIFNLLQPTLHCELGKEDSPIFALPLLLKQDPSIEEAFQHSFSWEFECSACGYTYQERCQKPLTTFTNLVPEWAPLNAVHNAPCNKCNNKRQKRKMVLDRLATIFALHFVNGLPHNDLKAYEFEFQGKLYTICTIIQYSSQQKHFVTWLRNDGLWIECDDLKAPLCSVYKQLEVPSNEVHMVFWEARSTTPKEMPVPVSGREFVENGCSLKSKAVPAEQKAQGEMDTQVKCVSVNSLLNNSVNLTMEQNNETSLLKAFDGLQPDDIITLNLVELKFDAEGRVLDSSVLAEQTQMNDSIFSAVGSDTCIDQSQDIIITDGVSDSSPSVLDDDKAILEPTQSTDDSASKNNSKIQNTSIVISEATKGTTIVNQDSDQAAPHHGFKSAVISVSPSCAETPSFENNQKSSALNWSSKLFINHLSVKKQVIPHPNLNQSLSKPKPEVQPQLKVDGQVPLQAEMFGGFRSKGFIRSNQNSKNTLYLHEDETSAIDVKSKSLIQPADVEQTATDLHTAKCSVSDLKRANSKTTEKKEEGTKHLSDTAKLRYKLLKRLKAKKQKLELLNQQLDATVNSSESKGKRNGVESPSSSSGHVATGTSTAQVNGTDADSVYTASSCTSIDSQSYEDFLADLLSPDTTTSSLSTSSIPSENTQSSECKSKNSTSVQDKVQICSTINTSAGSVDNDLFTDLLSNTTAGSCTENEELFNFYDSFFEVC